MDKEELAKKYNIDLKNLEDEQVKLAKRLEIKDKIDFNLADRFGAIDIVFIKNKILCGFIVCDKNYEVIDRAYFFDKARFPYMAGFRAYRELPAIIEAFSKLNEKPDVIFIAGQGIIHPRLGIASHLSLSLEIPVIGVSNSVIDCEIKGEDILRKGKKVGKTLVSKQGSRPMYINPGNQISIDGAYELCKKFINLPHNLPVPMHLASKYTREVKKELIRNN